MTGLVNNDHIRELCNDLVLAVEQDVKQRLITRFQAEFAFQTGMHGEPLEPVRQRGERGKDRKPFRHGSKIHKLFRGNCNP